MWKVQLLNNMVFRFEEAHAPYSQSKCPSKRRQRTATAATERKGDAHKHEPEEAQYEAWCGWPEILLPSLHIFSRPISQLGSPPVGQACSLMQFNCGVYYSLSNKYKWIIGPWVNIVTSGLSVEKILIVRGNFLNARRAQTPTFE